MYSHYIINCFCCFVHVLYRNTGLMERALVSGMETPADYLHLWKTYILYERRRINWSEVDFEHPDERMHAYQYKSLYSYPFSSSQCTLLQLNTVRVRVHTVHELDNTVVFLGCAGPQLHYSCTSHILVFVTRDFSGHEAR